MQPEDRFQTAGEFLEALESQTVVGLPEERSQGQGESGEKAPQSEQKKKGFKAPIFGGIVVAAVAAAFLAGSLLNSGGSGAQEAGRPGAESVKAQGEDPETPAADLAPTVNIGGKEYRTALTELDLRKQGLTDADILPLAEMSNLKELQLDGNQITDLTPLAGLTGLETLHLGGSEGGNESLQDLSPLSGLTNLKELYLPASSLNDLSPLAGLTGLERLALREGENRTSGGDGSVPIDGTDPDEGSVPGGKHPGFPGFCLQYDQAGVPADPHGGGKLPPGFQSLIRPGRAKRAGSSRYRRERLYRHQPHRLPDQPGRVPVRLQHPVPGTPAGTEKPDLPGVKRPAGPGGRPVYLTGTFIGLENLTTLTIRASGVTDLSPLSGLQKLQFLTLHTPAVTDLSPLAGLSGLTNLSVDGEHITDWSPVEHVPNVNRG